MQRLLSYFLLPLLVFSLSACGGSGDGASDGQSADASGSDASGQVTAADIGPVKSVDLGAINQELVAQGEELFNTRCKTCHRFGERYIGPDLTNTVSERDPVYIMNMILAPEEMLQKHPTAQQLMAEYGTMMTNQNLSEEQARAILEYLRTVDSGSAASSQ
jgi:mono/diheme cytochrome c family protein